MLLAFFGCYGLDFLNISLSKIEDLSSTIKKNYVDGNDLHAFQLVTFVVGGCAHRKESLLIPLLLPLSKVVRRQGGMPMSRCPIPTSLTKEHVALALCHWFLVCVFLGFAPSVQANSLAKTDECFLSSEPNTDILWQADMERGDLCSWSSFPKEETSFDSGRCERPNGSITEQVAHSGSRALLMSAHTPNGGESGCRQFRFPEPNRAEGLYYSFWIYLPNHYEVNYWAAFAQFKSRTAAGLNDPIWKLQLTNTAAGEMALTLGFKCQCLGPSSDGFDWHESGYNMKYFRQDKVTLEPRKWTFIEFYRMPSDGYDGEVAIWQDGHLLWQLKDIVTSYPDASDSFSLIAYGEDVWAVDDAAGTPWFTVIFDDISITRQRMERPG